MSKEGTWGLIGYGNIGKETFRQVSLSERKVYQRLGVMVLPSLMVNQKDGIWRPAIEHVSEIQQLENLDDIPKEPLGVASLEDLDEIPEITFVTIPSYDDGEIAYDYICHLLERGGRVVTAEKGAMANFFTSLKEKSGNFANLGINATVGGGTGMLEHAKLRCWDRQNVTQVHLALNGTLASILSTIAPPGGTPRSFGEAVKEARKMGYADPLKRGVIQNPLNVVREEATGDIPKKTAIFFNTVLADKPINWRDLVGELNDTEIRKVIEEANERRFIVSMYHERFISEHIGPEDDEIIGKFEHFHEGWHIVGGFRNTMRNPLFHNIANLTGPDNGFVIGIGPDQEDGTYKYSGPGAGPSPTGNTMLDDHLKMAGIRP